VVATAALAGCLLAPAPSQAYDLPAVNLGFTSFLDGGPPAGPGLYFAEYVQYYGSSQLNDQDGDKIALPDPKVTAWVSLTQLLYQSNQPVLLGGKWGLDLIVPVVGLKADYGAPGPFPADNGAGLGDLLVGPYLQWDPLMGPNGPRLMHRIELQVLLPTGKYDKDKELNPGSGTLSLNPYWAATYFVTPRCTSSLRLHYLWNAANDEPNRGFGAVDDAQAGAAIHANLAAEYEVMPHRLRLGMNSYYLKQITDTKAGGNDVADRREQVLGIGPGAVYHLSQEQHIFANLFTEVLAQNRTQGTRLTLRYVQHL